MKKNPTIFKKNQKLLLTLKIQFIEDYLDNEILGNGRNKS